MLHRSQIIDQQYFDTNNKIKINESTIYQLDQSLSTKKWFFDLYKEKILHAVPIFLLTNFFMIYTMFNCLLRNIYRYISK
jgi:hypothetical protein